MSKVRIYELAKEVGLKSKELADKLIEMGYPIKSHSSTVDEDTAAEIRRTVLGKTTVEVTEQRIEVKKRPGADRPSATVIRRRSKADKEEIARKAEEEEAGLAAEEAVKEAEAEAAEEAEVVVPEAEEAQEVETEEAPEEAVAEEAAPPEGPA
ncbi:MAG: translation initiation factor IF-2 N-terminal domain-containing protein, partial [Desulfobulbaceae bacterium]|nr:translation initiation factor IF-2 N-terminal domain-containing protein [Desulfobulbaceae bacterium]